MDHKFRPQATGTGNNRIARGTTAREPTPEFLHKGWSTRFVDSPINTTTACQALICRVHDSVHRLLGDIAPHEFKNRVAK
jgi:hypothetical protein